MYIYVKPLSEDGELIPNQHIFPRPSPWAVAWEATGLRLLDRCPYKMAFIPRHYNLYSYDIRQEGSRVVLYKDRKEVAGFEILTITWAMAFEYDVQSFLYGFIFRVWEWRWNEFGKLTKSELERKLARLEEKIDKSVSRRSERISRDDKE